MDPLFCLHDGSWISLKDVTSVIPRANNDSPSVLVCMGGGHPLRLFFETEGAAIGYAAELAGAINAMRETVE